MTEELDQISIASPLWTAPAVELQKHVSSVLNATRENLGLESSKSGFDLILADDEILRKLNREFRGKDKPTNVLSFPASSQTVLGDSDTLGEIYVSFETLTREADEQAKDFIPHFQHMVLHGFLHLLGYDHEDSAEAEVMEAIEIRILGDLKLSNPYEEASSTDG